LSTWDDTGHDVYGSAAHSYKAPSLLYILTQCSSLELHRAQFPSSDTHMIKLVLQCHTASLECCQQEHLNAADSLGNEANALYWDHRLPPITRRTRTECTLRLQTDSS